MFLMNINEQQFLSSSGCLDFDSNSTFVNYFDAQHTRRGHKLLFAYYAVGRHWETRTLYRLRNNWRHSTLNWYECGLLYPRSYTIDVYLVMILTAQAILHTLKYHWRQISRIQLKYTCHNKIANMNKFNRRSMRRCVLLQSTAFSQNVDKKKTTPFSIITWDSNDTIL